MSLQLCTVYQKQPWTWNHQENPFWSKEARNFSHMFLAVSSKPGRMPGSLLVLRMRLCVMFVFEATEDTLYFK